MWGKKKIKGTVYDLTHLDPFEFEVPCAGDRSAIRLQVQFSSHTFTEKYTPLHTPDLAISDGGDLRAFCLTRYGHSLSFPAAVKQAVAGSACLDSGRMHINTTLPGLAGPYLIAFKLRFKETRKFDGIMTVVSAHHRPNINHALPKAPFTVVVAATLVGRKISWK